MLGSQGADVPIIGMNPTFNPSLLTTPAADALLANAYSMTSISPYANPDSAGVQAANDLYATARSVLDPSGTHLTYSSQGLTSGSDGHGVGLGIKLGWSEPGRSGEGMVHVTVTSEGGSDDEQCSTTGGFSCPDTVQVGGEAMKVGTGDRGELVVLYRQSDGERAVVLVNPLFGNNSRTPVQDGFVSRRDVYRLVQDDRLDFPRPPSR